MTSARGDDFKEGRAVPVIPLRWFAAGIAFSVLTLCVIMQRAGLVIEGPSMSMALFCLAGITVASLAYGFRQPRTEPQRIARDLAEYVGCLGIMSLIGAIASYPAAAESSGFVDPTLDRIDMMLHFDWIGWYKVVSAHPTLQWLGAAAYASIFVTPAILLVHYAVTGKRGEARMFLAAFWTAALLTLLLFRVFPSEGPLAFLWHGPIPYMPTSALYQAQLIPALRSHMVHDVSLGALRGLVGAPSFHTASATLFIAAAWRAPGLRWPLITLNIAMLLATPVEGTHYLSDMMCGALVALIAIAAVRMTMWHFLADGRARAASTQIIYDPS